MDAYCRALMVDLACREAREAVEHLMERKKDKERRMGLTPFDLDALKLSADLLWGLGDNRWETFISIFIFAAVLRLGN